MIRTGRWAATAVAVVWVSWAVWDQFLTLPTDEIANHSSAVVQDRMQDCSGTFRQRYECKNQIIIQSDRGTFLAMLGRIAIVVMPPLLLFGGLRLAERRRGDFDLTVEDDSHLHPQRRHHRRRSNRS